MKKSNLGSKSVLIMSQSVVNVSFDIQKVESHSDTVKCSPTILSKIVASYFSPYSSILNTIKNKAL